MPAEAGIESVLDINNFNNLDSRFRRNDGVFAITTPPPRGEGSGGRDVSSIISFVLKKDRPTSGFLNRSLFQPCYQENEPEGGQYQKGRGDRAGKKDRGAAAGNDQGTAESHLHILPQHHAQNQWSGGKVNFRNRYPIPAMISMSQRSKTFPLMENVPMKARSE